MKARARQLHTDMCAHTLDNKTKNKLLGQIKRIEDDLIGIGCPVKPDEYVDAMHEFFSRGKSFQASPNCCGRHIHGTGRCNRSANFQCQIYPKYGC